MNIGKKLEKKIEEVSRALDRKGDFREIVSERIFLHGYVIRRELVGMEGCPTVTMDSGYTPSGEYIGGPHHTRYLIVEKGIRPQLRTPTSNVCSIGYCPGEKKWYGWSHRAMHGFRVGSVVQKGSVLCPSLPVGFKAKNLEDAKRMAEVFAEAVS